MLYDLYYLIRTDTPLFTLVHDTCVCFLCVCVSVAQYCEYLKDMTLTYSVVAIEDARTVNTQTHMSTLSLGGDREGNRAAKHDDIAIGICL